MRDNVDYRLLERLRVMQCLNQQPPAQQLKAKRATGAAHRLPTINLRD